MYHDVGGGNRHSGSTPWGSAFFRHHLFPDSAYVVMHICRETTQLNLWCLFKVYLPGVRVSSTDSMSDFLPQCFRTRNVIFASGLHLTRSQSSSVVASPCQSLPVLASRFGPDNNNLPSLTPAIMYGNGNSLFSRVTSVDVHP